MDNTIGMLNFLFVSDEPPLTRDELLTRFSDTPEERHRVEEVLTLLQQAGLVKRTKDKRLAPSLQNDLVVGRLSITRHGSGYVDPLGGTRAASVFLPQAKIGSALPRDLVIARRDRGTGRRRAPAGTISHILARAKTQFVGKFQKRGKLEYVEPDEHAATSVIHVTRKHVDRVTHDDKVVVELLEPLVYRRRSEGAVVKVLGRDGAPGVDTAAIIHEYHLPTDVPGAVAAEMETVLPGGARDNAPDRIDLRDQMVVTIDPVDAKDFDDAVSAKRLPQGGCLVGIHIADVSHYVQPQGATDAEARRRGTSVYLPTRVIPMLPVALSNDLASLREGVDRLTKSVLVEFDPKMNVRSCKVARSVIRSTKRLTYEHAQQLLDSGPKGLAGSERSIAAMLKDLARVARALRQQRFQKGSLELDLPEIKIVLDDEDHVVGVKKREHQESHSLIEELMLLANRMVARYFEDKRLPLLRRVHEPPDPEKLQEFAVFARSLGFKIGDPRNRHEIARVLKEAKGEPYHHAVHYGLLRSLAHAQYTGVREEHYALAFPLYCHFTSPIRRYPDLLVHQILDLALAGKRVPRRFQTELEMVGEISSATEVRAERAERELTEVLVLRFLADKIGERYQGVVTGVAEFGLFVELVAIGTDGLLPKRLLPEDLYRHDTAEHRLLGQRSGRAFQLGQELEVEVVSVNIDRRFLDLKLAETETPEEPPKKTRRQGSRRGRRS